MDNNESNHKTSKTLSKNQEGTLKTVSKRRYLVTEEQFEALVKGVREKKIKTPDTPDYKLNNIDFIKPGNTITFNSNLTGFHVKKMVVNEVQRLRSGEIKLIAEQGSQTHWFKSEEELLSVIDCVCLPKNLNN